MNAVCEQQRKMALFCRTGQDASGTGMRPEKASIYRELILANVQSALRNNYPLTYVLLEGEKWEELTRDFFGEYSCLDPQFWKMPQGLASYVKESGWGEKRELPFLSDLLDFEWLEMEVFMMEDQLVPRWSREGDVLDDHLVLNPEHRLKTYSYPVFSQLSLDASWKKGEYPLFCYRHPETLGAHFFSLSRFFSSAIQILTEQLRTGREVLHIAAERHGFTVDDQLLVAGEKFFKSLIDKRAILGFQPIRNSDETIL
jgi:hypothetical protein